jgi:hypothetical protein
MAHASDSSIEHFRRLASEYEQLAQAFEASDRKRDASRADASRRPVG